MSFLDVKLQQDQCKFDWDEISVGNIQLDHSQNFFSKKHYEHERLNEMEILQKKLVKTELNDCTSKENQGNEKENVSHKFKSPAETKSNVSKIPITPANVVIKEVEDCRALQVDVKKDLEHTGEAYRKVATNLACEWSTKKPLSSKVVTSKGAVLKSMPPPPQAYLVKDVYQRKREEAERRREEEERKLREFHSRPAPNFNQFHELQKRKPVHAVTVSITPQVLKKSREAEEKRRRKFEEWKQKHQPPKFEPRPPTVLKEKPFVPEKKPFVIQQCPFNLQMEKRLKERKHYDEIKQKSLEEKQKQVEIEEEERKRLEKERIRELRKATTFKARPNPFKN